MKARSSLGKGGEFLQQNLSQSPLDIQNELPSWRAQLGHNGLVVRVSVEVLGVSGQLLLLQNDDRSP